MVFALGPKLPRLYALPIVFLSCSAALQGGETSQNCVLAPTSSAVISVKDKGAKGDGLTDDTAAIQAAIDELVNTHPGGTVFVPDGTYMVNALVSVRLKSQLTFQLSAGASLKALPNDQGNYRLLSASSVMNINIVGGRLEGERDAHLGTTGEWGHCLSLLSAQNVVVQGVTAAECWGDGFYVGSVNGAAGAPSSQIKFCGVLADHNRRQGMSVTSANGLVVQNSRFQNTKGTPPEAGIDIEPNQGQSVNDALIVNSSFEGNAGNGLQIGPAYVDRATTFVTNVIIRRNLVSNNGSHSGSAMKYGIHLSSSDGNLIDNNQVLNTIGIGIGVIYTTNARVTGNTVTGTIAPIGSPWPEKGAGVQLEEDKGTLLTGNTLTGNAGYGFFSYHSVPVPNPAENTIYGNGLAQP